ARGRRGRSGHPGDRRAPRPRDCRGEARADRGHCPRPEHGAAGGIRPARPRFSEVMSTIAPAELVERIWARDATLWTSGDEAKWLGWLDEPMRMRSRIDDLLRFVEDATA